jgi:hypothetical protein
MYFLAILMCVNVLPYLLGKYYQLHTELLQTLKIYKKQFSHI